MNSLQTQRPKLSKSTIGLLVAAGLSQMIVVIDYMAVAVAMPDMARDFGVDPVSLQWVLTGYILAFSATLGIAGPLGDRFGRKRLLLVGIALFGLVSLWVGFSTSATMVIIARVALGIGGGMLFPLSTAVVSAGESKETLPRTLAILTGVGTIGMAIGPVVGGVFTEALSWRWIFWMNSPIAAIAFIAVVFLSKESQGSRRRWAHRLPRHLALDPGDFPSGVRRRSNSPLVHCCVGGTPRGRRRVRSPLRGSLSCGTKTRSSISGSSQTERLRATAPPAPSQTQRGACSSSP